MTDLKRLMARYAIVAQDGADPDVVEPGLIDRMQEIRQQLRSIIGSKTNPNLPPAEPGLMLINDDFQRTQENPDYNF